VTGARQQQRGQAGFTLVELMISLVILSVAVAATFGLSTSMMNSYRDHRRMVQVERAGRAAMETLAEALRNGSPGVASGNIIDLTGDCASFGGISVTNSTTGPDSVDIVYAAGGAITSARAAFSDPSAQLEVADASGFSAGDLALIVATSSAAPADSHGHLVQVDAVSAPAGGNPNWILDVSNPCGATSISVVTSTGTVTSYDQGSLVLRARRGRFYIDTPAALGVPTLMYDPDGAAGGEAAEPLAMGIEELQIAVGYDANGDGTITDTASNSDEILYNVDPDVAPAGATTPRAFRLTVVARSIWESSTAAMSTRPAVEDRNGAASADQYRRRILSAVVEARNFQRSP
jgi:prepilin-type N-terminal cleavage/methylation domain-containing protein